MNISTERAFDALPYAVEIYEKLKVENYVKATREKMAIEQKQGKKHDEVLVGLDLFKYVLKNINSVKEEVFYLLSIIEEKPVDEVKKQSMIATIKSLKELLSNKELVELFQVGYVVGYEDTLYYLHSHYSIDYAMKLPIRNVIKLLAKAIHRDQENKAWQLYVNINPHMTEESYMTFEEFLNRQKSIDEKPVSEILSEVKETLDTFKGRWAT